MEEALELATMIRNMALARASGAATVIWPIRWGAGIQAGGAYGPTVITLTRRMRRLAATNNQALAAKPTK